MRLLPFLTASLAAALCALAAPVDTTNFTESTFFQNSAIALPTGLAWAPDGSGRLFVATKTGSVRVIQNGSLLSTPFLSLNAYGFGQSQPATDPCYTDRESGLLSICFDPDFKNNHYVYFFVTIAPSPVPSDPASVGEAQIIRYTDSGSVGTNKTIIVSGLPTKGTNHNGGGLGIGPDGRLYWSIGDNTLGSNSDVQTTLAAKVGRANRFTGAACNDNPFFDGAGPNNDYIWARGLRNPFRLAFQPGTGALWVNVVGGDFTTGFEQIFAVQRGSHSGWQFGGRYENNQPSNYLAPILAYHTWNASSGRNLATSIAASGAVRSNGVVTFTTTATHPFRAGAKATIAGVSSASFNGTVFVASRVSDTQFTAVQAGPDETSSGGTATAASIGNCITGGAFYDSTAFPAAYRGNYFFCDVGGNIERVTIDASNKPSSVDHFVTGFIGALDITTGPDGALYYSQHNTPGVIKRLATTSTAQNVIVQPTALNVWEGGSSVVNVRLAQAPASNVIVTITKLSGDTDLAVSAGSTLTFTPANWNVVQTFTISAAEDADLDNDTATFRVSAPGLPSYDVLVNGIDNDEPNLVLSAANVSVNEGSTATFTVRLANAPASNVAVTVSRTAGDPDVTVSSGATLTFTPANYATPQTVTLAAAQDANTTNDSATISVSAPGEVTRTVAVTVIDDDFAAPAFTSSPVTTAVVNAAYSYDANASGNPAATFSLSGTPPTGMSIDATTGIISWTPTSTGSFAVTVQASNGVLPNATQSFTIVVSPDAAPSAVLTLPLPGSVVSGPTAEFFGNGVDDVGTVKAEFFVDGVLRYTDTSAGNHFHINGAHVSWDTTQLTNGPHTLKFQVTDTIGQTGSQQIQVVVANGQSAWKNERFSAAELADSNISGDLADSDKDGLPNIFEYGFDTLPKSTASSRKPTLETVNVSGIDYLALRFVAAKWATDLTFTVEAASSLAGPWTSIDPSAGATQVSRQDDTPSFGLQTFLIRDSVPISSGPRFLRLRVTK